MVRLIDLFFLVMIFEGAVRRYLVPEYSLELQVLRDLLPTLALLVFLSSEKENRLQPLPPVVKLGLTCYVLVVLIQLFNPQLWSMLVGLNGLRAHFAYLPLLFLAPVYLSRLERVPSRLLALCVIALPVAALGLLQAQLPVDHVLNSNVRQAHFGSEGLIRASGTFSYIAGFAVFCQFVVVAAVALLILRPFPSRAGIVACIAGTAALIGCLSSGSRGPVYGSLLQLTILASLLLWSRFRNRVMKRILTTAVLAAVALSVTVTWVPRIYSAFVERAETAGDDIGERLLYGFTGWISVLDTYPLGNGTGMGHHQAGVLVGQEAGFAMGLEAELDRIVYEIGIFGFGAFLLFRLALLLRVGFGARTLTDPLRAVVAALSFSTMAWMLAGGVYTPMANALFMLAAGAGVFAVNKSQLRFRAPTDGRPLSHAHFRRVTRARL